MASIHTMLTLTEGLIALDDVEGLVEFARAMNPGNQEVQLDMDRQQTEIDAKRAYIRGIIVSIAKSN